MNNNQAAEFHSQQSQAYKDEYPNPVEDGTGISEIDRIMRWRAMELMVKALTEPLEA